METVIAADRAEWRRWLAKNFARSDEIWLVFYKKAAGKPGVSYEHAVEEALCFGWIDGQKKKLDEECYAFRFTPRKPRSAWSKSNLERVERLIASGKMMPSGLKAYNSGERREVAPLPTTMPKKLEDRFRKQRAAWTNYAKFPPGYRRVTAGWVASAKKEDTRIKRLEKLIEFAARNERIEFM
ncbi:MAG TPA: YdeI/OmpD-associated family protein [Bryobacteraceae bacterium]|nr:YdeI/OmpD-associated family protein [Bryobacteraceae bacterium]